MSAQLLATELNNLITESKRKHQDLRQVRYVLLPYSHRVVCRVVSEN